MLKFYLSIPAIIIMIVTVSYYGFFRENKDEDIYGCVFWERHFSMLNEKYLVYQRNNQVIDAVSKDRVFAFDFYGERVWLPQLKPIAYSLNKSGKDIYINFYYEDGAQVELGRFYERKMFEAISLIDNKYAYSSNAKSFDKTKEETRRLFGYVPNETEVLFKSFDVTPEDLECVGMDYLSEKHKRIAVLLSVKDFARFPKEEDYENVVYRVRDGSSKGFSIVNKSRDKVLISNRVYNGDSTITYEVMLPKESVISDSESFFVFALSDKAIGGVSVNGDNNWAIELSEVLKYSFGFKLIREDIEEVFNNHKISKFKN